MRPKHRPLPSGAQTQAQTHGLDHPLIAGKISSEKKTTARRVESDDSTSSKLKIPNEAMRGPVRDKQNVEHHSIGEAIEYTLHERKWFE